MVAAGMFSRSLYGTPAARRIRDGRTGPVQQCTGRTQPYAIARQSVAGFFGVATAHEHVGDEERLLRPRAARLAQAHVNFRLRVSIGGDVEAVEVVEARRLVIVPVDLIRLGSGLEDRDARRARAGILMHVRE